jgi:hypothetical protein
MVTAIQIRAAERGAAVLPAVDDGRAGGDRVFRISGVPLAKIIVAAGLRRRELRGRQSEYRNENLNE